ncbi:hypothetical protein F5X99DRAFT_379682 [Biscogniauxia marginata]|nr:hypothetical protein F5X99DRAFT_379682 [Biscogniauxia marginata]
MAKSSRASTVKANNQRLKAKVFSPVEEERNARLSAKLLELAAQPKPERPVEMKIVSDDDDADDAKADEENHDDTAMDLDTAKTAVAAAVVTSKRSHKKRIEKRRKTSKIVFPKYKDRVTKRRKN